ncbi:DUF6090 family protein [Winogradskyella alexanderae]|nr:DUF6090 family protein [Winogradskyella alexanderae]
MIKFFRKIRQRLLTENKFSKYVLYAIGEIVLVVIGILIALQVNNWNDTKKRKTRYEAVLQQIYTVIDQDIEKLILRAYGVNKQIEIIDSLIQNPESINPKLIPHLFFYIDRSPSSIESEISYQLNYLDFNPENLKEANLNKSLASYGNAINESSNKITAFVTPSLVKLKLPTPSITFGYSVLNEYENIDTTFFSKSEIDKTLKLLEDPLFLNALKSARSRKSQHLIFENDLLNLAKTNKALIREYYPSVKLLYYDIGLVGDATKYKNWDNNVRLTLTNDLEAIWEGDVILENGFVKFREGENWKFNWGGSEFPLGNIISYGDNIKVKSGAYHVILDMTKKTYKFVQLED